MVKNREEFMPVKKIKFDPASLSTEEQEAVVEHYLGVHPKFFVYWGTCLAVDIYNSHREGHSFNGFLPDLKKKGIL